MTGVGAALLSVMVIAALLLGGAGLWLLARGHDRKRALLMIVAALVLLGNVVIWTAPLP